jgi:hypothetical protein
LLPGETSDVDGTESVVVKQALEIQNAEGLSLGMDSTPDLMGDVAIHEKNTNDWRMAGG